MEKSSVFCFVFLGIFGIGCSQWVVDEDVCTTPDGHSGLCVAIKSCVPMVNFLTTVKRPISQQVLSRIRAYGCQGVSNKVCCPSGPITIGGATSSQDSVGPPDVSSHRNLNLLPRSCGYLDTGDRIRLGKDAYLNEFPWMALITYRTRSGRPYKCGGSIISRNYILTAAHCITNTKIPLAGVRIGEHSIQSQEDCVTENDVYKCNPPAQDLRIEEVIPHPEYNPNSFQNDIGLLRVSTIDLNKESTRPICLPLSSSQRNFKLSYVVVTGWGITDTGNASDILQKVDLEVADKSVCTKLYSGHNIVLTDKQTCAGGKDNKDSCPGDSGGPMQYPSFVNGETNYVQFGIVSFGPKFCGLEGYPGVYTLTSYYMDWILDNLKP